MNIIPSNYKKLLLPILFGLILIALLVVPSLSFAQGLKNINTAIDITAQGAGVKNESDFTQLAAFLIQTLLGILGLVFIGLIIYGGVQWMTATGNEDKVLKAKKVIINSAVGLIIIILAYSIAIFVFTALQNSNQ